MDNLGILYLQIQFGVYYQMSFLTGYKSYK